MMVKNTQVINENALGAETLATEEKNTYLQEIQQLVLSAERRMNSGYQIALLLSGLSAVMVLAVALDDKIEAYRVVAGNAIYLSLSLVLAVVYLVLARGIKKRKFGCCVALVAITGSAILKVITTIVSLVGTVIASGGTEPDVNFVSNLIAGGIGYVGVHSLLLYLAVKGLKGALHYQNYKYAYLQQYPELFADHLPVGKAYKIFVGIWSVILIIAIVCLILNT